MFLRSGYLTRKTDKAGFSATSRATFPERKHAAALVHGYLALASRKQKSLGPRLSTAGASSVHISDHFSEAGLCPSFLTTYLTALHRPSHFLWRNLLSWQSLQKQFSKLVIVKSHCHDKDKGLLSLHLVHNNTKYRQEDLKVNSYSISLPAWVPNSRQVEVC